MGVSVNQSRRNRATTQIDSSVRPEVRIVLQPVADGHNPVLVDGHRIGGYAISLSQDATVIE